MSKAAKEPVAPEAPKALKVPEDKLLAVSIPANIAEGYASGGNSQFGRYLRIAQGSLAEVEYYLILPRDLCYLTEASYIEADALRSEVGYLLHRLLKSLQRN